MVVYWLGDHTHRYHYMYSNDPILWFRKLNNTVDTTRFESKSITLKIVMETAEASRLRIRIFGVPLDCPADVFCNNK